MPTYSQQQLLDVLFNQTEVLLDLAIKEWQVLPHPVFAGKPAPGAWSANECLQHLNNYGRYYLPAISKAMQQHPTTPAQQFKSGWFGNYFTKIMLPKQDGKLRLRMKSPQDYAPTSILESHVVIAEFVDQQEQLLRLIREAGAVDLNSVRVGISLAPILKLKLGDVFLFLLAHEVRHVDQARRALKSEGQSSMTAGMLSLLKFEG